jgi:hypothetical protein
MEYHHAVMSPVRHGPGRPPKYGRASRAVTVTLPDDVIARLATIDVDLGRAIVALAERRTPKHARPPRPAEIASYGKHAVIVVTPVRALRRLAGVQLVPIGNGRALIALGRSHSIPGLELQIGDVIAGNGVSADERRALTAIADILRRTRRSRGVSLEERMIIVLESARQRRSGGSARPARRRA